MCRIFSCTLGCAGNFPALTGNFPALTGNFPALWNEQEILECAGNFPALWDVQEIFLHLQEIFLHFGMSRKLDVQFTLELPNNLNNFSNL